MTSAAGEYGGRTVTFRLAVGPVEMAVGVVNPWNRDWTGDISAGETGVGGFGCWTEICGGEHILDS